MIDKNAQDSILSSISAAGKTQNEEIKVNINLSHVLSLSSGAARIQSSCVRNSKLILGQPISLSSLSNLQIRCVLCSRVITYPAWYYVLSYAVNQFHYFICFDSSNTQKPTAKCYKR